MKQPVKNNSWLGQQVNSWTFSHVHSKIPTNDTNIFATEIKSTVQVSGFLKATNLYSFLVHPS